MFVKPKLENILKILFPSLFPKWKGKTVGFSNKLVGNVVHVGIPDNNKSVGECINVATKILKESLGFIW